MSRFFRRDQPHTSVPIPIKGTVGSAYAVYFAPGSGTLEIPALAEVAARWSDAHLEPPLRDAVAAIRNAALLSIEVKAVQELPPLPIEPLRYLGLGELEERIVQKATHLVLVLGMDLNMHPRAGMWAVIAAALGVREHLHGVLFDPDALRIVDPDKATRWFSPTGAVAVAKHIIVPFSIGDRGLGWMTTRGLGKFGLPDLELRDVPPNLDTLSVFMSGVAQRLVEETFRSVAEHNGKVDQLKLASEIAIDRAVVARALAEQIDAGSAPSKAANVALCFDSTNGGAEPPMIRVERPPGFAGDTGVWLNHVAELLLGSQHKVRITDTSADAMTRAHERAVSELPRVRQRFAVGLKPGEVLFIKHGFPTTTGSQEYIWAAVNQWQGSTLTVQVANDPREVAGLRMGMTVRLDEADIFDWVLQLPDDTSEGGYTSEVALDEGHEASAE